MGTLTIQYIIVVLFLAAYLATFFILKSKLKNFNISLFYKISAYVLMAVFFFRFMLNGDAISDTTQLVNSNFSSTFDVVVSLLLTWGLTAFTILLAMYPFYNNKGSLNLIRFFGLPIAVLSLVFLSQVSIGIVGASNFANIDVRTVLLAIEIALSIGFIVTLFFKKESLTMHKKDWLSLLLFIPVLIAAMPSYMLSALFGLANNTTSVIEFELAHRWIVYGSVLIPIILYFALRKKDKSTIALVITYVAVTQLMVFSIGYRLPSFFSSNFLGAWPLHLCNTGVYFVALCSIFKMKRLFYFTLLINVLGCIISLTMPNLAATSDLISSGVLRFYTSHFVVYALPILMVLLNMYERPTPKRFVYSTVIFTIYFVLVMFINPIYGKDYFFINSNFVAEKLGYWAESLRLITINITLFGKNLIFYPLYQPLFYLGYVLGSVAMWFLFELLFSKVDSLNDMHKRKEKIKLDHLALLSQSTLRSESEPMNKLNHEKTIVKLTNFTKRYGRSNVYAVKNANLELFGGEIFGFLGPNGAGKSTIIKSLVGIQNITEGEINICGFDMEKQSVEAKRNIGFVPDHYALYEKLTGREFINYIADLYNVSQADRDVRIKKYVTLLNLNDAFDNQIRTYSHGMKQKITIISALVHNPKFWILDEPLTGLDPNSIFQVKECMKEHAKAGNIVFFSSHIIDVVEKICDKIAIIKKGNIIRYATVKEIEKTTSIEEYYLSAIEENVQAVKVEREVLERDKQESLKESETSKKLTWASFKSFFTKKQPKAQTAAIEAAPTKTKSAAKTTVKKPATKTTASAAKKTTTKSTTKKTTNKGE